MLHKIVLQSSDGNREYPFVPDGAAYIAAIESGEIAVGMDIVYRNHLVNIVDRQEMLVLSVLPQFAGGIPNMDGANWSFMFNGQPVNPEFMRGGPFGQ